MKGFMDKDFLLNNSVSKELFHQVAAKQPICDYHCHLDPKVIYQDTKFDNITQIWLGGDHYKWRAMRSCGVDEEFITGSASDRDKFLAFAKIMPLLIGNPIYHWSHLELQRFFGITEVLNQDSANQIYDKANSILKEKSFTARKFIKMSNVETICTTDDPCDSLEYHKKINADPTFKTKVYPTFRPDKAVNIFAPEFCDYIKKLGEDITDIKSLIDTLYSKIDYFNSVGCKISDHALLDVPYSEVDEAQADAIFKKKLSGEELTNAEVDSYMTYVLLKLAEKYYELDWAMQIHIGALRNNNTKMFKKLGPDTGYDSIDDGIFARNLSRLLDSLEVKNKLPKTILYVLDPRLNYVTGTMLGNFQGSGIKGKIQYGSAWWFYDHVEGMRRHLKDLAALGALGSFVGMLTDSRSLLSYPRHEYFRRILCDLFGQWVEEGLYPYDIKALSSLVEDICINNIKGYLGV